MTAVPSPELDAIEATSQQAEPGFRRALPRHRIEGQAGTPFEGLWIEVADMDVGDALRIRRSLSYTFDAYRVAAPFVLAWNVEAPIFGAAEVPETTMGGVTVPAHQSSELTGWERLPPPAEAGPDVFLRLPDAETTAWILRRLAGFAEELDAAAIKPLRRLASASAGSSDAMPPATPDESSSTASRRTSRSSTKRSASTGAA